MFDDPKKDLKWLESQLLAEEETPGEDSEEDWLAEARVLMDNDYSGSARQESVLYDDEEEAEAENLAVYADAPPAPKAKKPKKEKGIGGLVFLACIETLGIIAVLLWWVLWLL